MQAAMVYVPVFLVSLSMAFVLTLIVRGIARRLDVVDHPDHFRKVQDRPVPRLGGVAIFLSYFGALVLCGLSSPNPELSQFFLEQDFVRLAFGAALVLIVGIWDDVHGMRARWKFLLLSAITVLMYVGGFRITAVSHPFSAAPVKLGLVGLPVTLFWFLGCINAMNLIDGLDGLAAGVALFVGMTVCVSSMILGNLVLALLALALMGATLGFLVFNFHPASIYLGDSGSLLLGFLIAGLGLQGSQKSRVVVALLIPVIALGLPVMDTVLAIVRRWARALPVSSGDRQHIHHKLLDRGFSHRQSVLLLYVGCLILAGCALLMTASRSRAAAWTLAGFGVAFFVVIQLVGRSELSQAKRRLGFLVAGKRRSGETRSAGYAALERMARADTPESVWRIFGATAARMDLNRARMTIEPPSGVPGAEPACFLWERESPEDGEDLHAVVWSAALPLVHGGVRFGELQVSKVTDGVPLAPELPEMLEMLRRGLASHLNRLSQQPSVGVPPAPESPGGPIQPM